MSLPRLIICVTLMGLIGLNAPLLGQGIDFNRVIRPILSNRCIACHGPDD
jgi:hypothetical protein